MPPDLTSPPKWPVDIEPNLTPMAPQEYTHTHQTACESCFANTLGVANRQQEVNA